MWVMAAGAAVLFSGLAAPAAEQPEPRLIDLNIVALDKQGQSVPDLTEDEFKVTDSGKPQKITFFRHKDSRRWKLPTLAPGEFSNRSGPNVPRATVILFDLLNETFATRGVAEGQLVHNLESLEDTDYVYLYLLTLDGHLYPVRALPSKPGDVPPRGGPSWTRNIKTLLDQALRSVVQVRRLDIDVFVRTGITYQALTTLAVQLSRIPGRKDVVWITDGVPIELGPNRSDTGDFIDFTPLLRQLSQSLDRSAVSIYPVRQVMLGSPDNVDTGRSGIGSIDTLDQFAGMTGGRADAGKDIGAAVRQAVTDVRTSYQIGYYPPDKNWDDKYHKVRLTTTRKNVRLQAKTGYYAWREPPGANTDQAINAAIQNTFDAAEIGIRGTFKPDTNAGGAMHLNARIDAQDVAFVRDGDHYNGELRLGIIGYAPGVQPQGGPVIPLDLHYTAAERDSAFQQGIDFTQNVTVPENVQLLRLIVFDRNSNAIGSLTLPVVR